jgi:glycosyltransferase involved in cell wall biosynthesis
VKPSICAIVPTYDNPRTIRTMVEQVRPHLPVLVVDDGSGPEGRAAAAALAREGLARVVVREWNGGKGAAVKDGFREAQALGYTHALQIDADGQHDVGDLPRFLAAARAHPDALVLGEPIFDAAAPLVRVRGHRFCRIWTTLATGGPLIRDVLCGYRVYPLEPALRTPCGDGMEFDAEIAIRLVWAGCPVVNVPTRIRYLSAEEGGVSHFRLFRDNVRIVSRYFGWCAQGLLRMAAGWAPNRTPAADLGAPGPCDPQGEP